jgi:uncharacterized protein YjbJ (UPF0337 family)
MAKEHVTGKVDELKGKVKQGVGGATGDHGLQGEGLVDEAKGKVKQAYGDVKDTIKHGDRQAGTDVHDK